MIDFEEFRKKREATSEFGKTLGVKYEEFALGEATLSLEVKDFMKNRVNSIHGGVLFSLCDQACGTACATHEIAHVTLDATIHYMHPALNVNKLIAKAKEIKYGKHVCVYEVYVYDEDMNDLCYGTFTYSVLDNPELILK